MENVVFLLTKDCMSCESLPCYGNSYWKTPNIDELVSKGTVFKKHYTAGASTAMSITAMLSGHYPYEFESRKLYTNVKPSEFPSVFDHFQAEQYECHLIWPEHWMKVAWRFIREFGDESKTILHNLDIDQETSNTQNSGHRIVRNDVLLQNTLDQIYSTLDSIDYSQKQFVWMHLPHILKGRRCYMDDMDAFDAIVGHVRGLVGDDSIIISSDHGHMNMHKGLVGYGFHVYDPIIHIPLITPRIHNQSVVEALTCNVDLPVLLKTGTMPSREYIISETAYKGQPHRKTAIFDGRYKYIFNKKDGSEEFYDLLWDPEENYNILMDKYYDKDRGTHVIFDELFFYPEREEALNRVDLFRDRMRAFWVKESWLYERYGVWRKRLSVLKKFIRKP